MMEVVKIIEFKERREIVEQLIEILLVTELDGIDKKAMYDIVMNMKKKTEKQKDRFIRFFGLKTKKETVKEIAEAYNCTTNTIRNAILTTKLGLYRVSEEDFFIFKKICEKYQKN